jgi:hypothetical protein
MNGPPSYIGGERAIERQIIAVFPEHTTKTIVQMGDLILQQVDAIPTDARRIPLKVVSDGRISIPGCDGYFFQRTVRRQKSPAA